MWKPENWVDQYLRAYKEEYSGKGKYGIHPERAMLEAGADAALKSFADWLRSQMTDYYPSYADIVYLYLAEILEGKNEQIGQIIYIQTAFLKYQEKS